ncbi:aldo/keto reductase [Rhizobium leguminosarum]|uniref:aldo/keto reductase n=1 Tax=Rhizobium leguminosarum TaxID=384 RepID=UPI001FDFBA64|nr:aldo/keto reductase [Rhizobium leguminosarum]
MLGLRRRGRSWTCPSSRNRRRGRTRCCWPSRSPAPRCRTELAASYGTTPTGIAVAWITRHPANIQVVLGTTNPQRVAESAKASSAKNGTDSSAQLATSSRDRETQDPSSGLDLFQVLGFGIPLKRSHLNF